MKKKWGFIIFFGTFGLGYFIGAIHLHSQLSLEYGSVKNIFIEARVFAEVIYFVMASLLLPIAFIQYRSDKKKEKKGTIQYAHQLFRYYTEEILTLDKKYDLKMLETLSKKEDIQEFNDLLNKIDTFAAAFIYGIADFESGKVMMGNTYCAQIQNYLPAIIRISNDNFREGFENLFKLEKEWRSIDG